MSKSAERMHHSLLLFHTSLLFLICVARVPNSILIVKHKEILWDEINQRCNSSSSDYQLTFHCINTLEKAQTYPKHCYLQNISHFVMNWAPINVKYISRMVFQSKWQTMLKISNFWPFYITTFCMLFPEFF